MRYMFRKQPFVSEWNNPDPLDGRDAPFKWRAALFDSGHNGRVQGAGGRESSRQTFPSAIKTGGNWQVGGGFAGRNLRWKVHCTKIPRTQVPVPALPPGLGPSPLWMGFGFLLCKGEGCTIPSPAPKSSFPGTTTQMPTAVVSSQGSVASQGTLGNATLDVTKRKSTTATGIGYVKDRDTT